MVHPTINDALYLPFNVYNPAVVNVVSVISGLLNHIPQCLLVDDPAPLSFAKIRKFRGLNQQLVECGTRRSEFVGYCHTVPPAGQCLQG